MNTLTIVECEDMSLGGYQIRIPQDFTLISYKGANLAAYESGNASLRLFISRFPAAGMTLTDFVLAKGGSDIETDKEINGFPAASYRSMEAFNGALYSTLTFVLEDNGHFMALTFQLVGITAEAEAEAILHTLSAA